jgi:NAD(P)-dependent dehydrogenase (short-subunit alcohol dehydrogenase family)
MGWIPDRLPTLSDKIYAITGGNAGLGLEAAKILAGKGARVVITARDEEKATGAVKAIREAVPGAKAEHVLLDLTDPTSIKAAAAALRQKAPRLDAMINNAGVMQTPLRRTSEGFELQFATNHLGHFRLNALIFDTIEKASGRIVPVSSIVHKSGSIAFDDLNSERRYDATDAYSQSKLANLLYAFELQRRLAARGSSVTVISAHPGYSATNLQSSGLGMEGGSVFFRWLWKILNVIIAQTATEGAYPLVLAAAAPEAKPGAFYGPTKLGESRGAVGECPCDPKARDLDVARKLWEKTEAMVGPFFAATDAPRTSA